MSYKDKFNTLAQICLPVLTVLGYALTSFKYPQYGLVVALASQVFWLYSSYRAWKEANQIGIFITTIIIILTLTYGVVNYWLL